MCYEMLTCTSYKYLGNWVPDFGLACCDDGSLCKWAPVFRKNLLPLDSMREELGICQVTQKVWHDWRRLKKHASIFCGHRRVYAHRKNLRIRPVQVQCITLACSILPGEIGLGWRLQVTGLAIMHNNTSI